MKRAIKIVVAACISIGLIVWAFWKADVSVIADVFASADWRWVAVAVCVVLATPLVHCWRWRILIRMTGDDAPYVPLVPVYFAGMLANLVLPAELGLDAVCVQVCERSQHDAEHRRGGPHCRCVVVGTGCRHLFAGADRWRHTNMGAADCAVHPCVCDDVVAGANLSEYAFSSSAA
jgi:hypothetical protein